MNLKLRFAIRLMKWGNRHPRFGGKDCYTEAFVRPGENEISIATRREFEDGDGFFRMFEDRFLLKTSAEKTCWIWVADTAAAPRITLFTAGRSRSSGSRSPCRASA